MFRFIKLKVKRQTTFYLWYGLYSWKKTFFSFILWWTLACVDWHRLFPIAGPNAGEMMMSVFWYYRPEQTEVGRIPNFHGDVRHRFFKLHVLVLIEVVGRNISWNVYGCFTSAMIPYSFLFFPSLNTYFCCLWTISVSCNTVSVLENVVHVATRACVRLLSVNCNDYSNLSLTMLRSPFFFFMNYQ